MRIFLSTLNNKINQTNPPPTDEEKPIISLKGAPYYDIIIGGNYIELGATAVDNMDGDISANIIITGTINTNIPGIYYKYYNVSDSSGNAANQVIRTITVFDLNVGLFPYTFPIQLN